MQYLVTPDTFLFKYNRNGFKDIDSFVWAPKWSNRSPGIRVMMHANPAKEYAEIGSPSGRTHSTTTVKLRGLRGLDELTGVDGLKNYTYPRCPNTKLYGGAYVVASEHAGLGIFTDTGIQENGLPHFMQTKQVYSTNPHGHEIYIGFPCKHGRFSPFVGLDRVLDVRCGQAIEYLYLDTGTQAQQKMSFSLYNTNSDIKVEYSINVLLAGKGAGRQDARVWTDNDQGGSTIVGGVIGAPNHRTLVENAGFTVYTSKANPTQAGVFTMRPFRIEVTWEEFMAVLEHAAELSNKSLEDKFGEDADNPDSWELHSVNYAHEIHNPDYHNLNASAGGRLKYFQLKAI